MMKTRLPPSLVLITVLLAACAPLATPSQSPAESVMLVPTATPIPSDAPALKTPTHDPGIAQPPVPTLLPVATSRGPDLHATDPTTVSLASGKYQFVEFFRFTWGTCRSMAPMVHGLEAEYFGKIQFTYLDADDPLTDEFQRWWCSG